ncbi:hypothetical protein BDK51DRAFT_27003, partial [Blyttiomyces helicus]
TSTIAAAHALTYLSGQIDPSQIFLVNFGSPRVGNSDFAEFFNSAGFGDIWRSANYDDLVPQVEGVKILFNSPDPLISGPKGGSLMTMLWPPRAFGYVHVGPSSIGLDQSANPPNPSYCGADGSGEFASNGVSKKHH